MEFLTQIDHWTWWVIGVLLIMLEMFAPAAFFLWMGISAIITGGFLWVFPTMEWPVQLVIFSIQSILSIFVWRKFFHHISADSDQPLLNKRAQQFIGRVFTLEKDMVNGVGQIKIDDSTWKVLADEDYLAQSKVKVIGEDGMNLKVNLVD